MSNPRVESEASSTVRVSVGELCVSSNTAESLVSYGLGSCIAVLIYHEPLRIGGMAHVQLPSSKHCSNSAERMWAAADRAIPELLRRAEALGAQRHRLRVGLVGGASVMDSSNYFQIGRKNHLAARQILWQFGVIIDAEAVGGAEWRTARLNISSGRVHIQTQSGTEELQ
jgi:chemotaxis protein CheD